MPVNTAIFNGLSDSVMFAMGELSQNQFADKKGVARSNYRAMLNDCLKEDLKTLAIKYERSVNTLEQFRTTIEQLETECEQYRTLAEQSKTVGNSDRTELERLRTENKHLLKIQEQQAGKFEQYRLFYEQHNGKDSYIRFIGSHSAENIILTLLAVFGVVGSYDLLQSFSVVLAASVCLPLGFMMLHFTAKGETLPKVFCMAFELIVIGIFFGVFPESITNYLFTISAPVMVGLIAFGKRFTKFAANG